MQIGAFAKLCKTKISVLRHYDKEGLLCPDYVDRFTGYRYYAKEQIAVFTKINVLKRAGFSLTEIKDILADHAEIPRLFAQKKTELNEMLHHLLEAEQMLLGDETMIQITWKKEADGMTVTSAKVARADYQTACEAIEHAVAAEDCQRISGYTVQGDAEIEVSCKAIRLNDDMIFPQEPIDLPFEKDESIIGKWEVVGEFAVKEDFLAGRTAESDTRMAKHIYFLPNGARYWCYGWTKGKLLFDTGDSSTVNEFTTEMHDGEQYMFVSFKSYYYRRGGNPTVLVLRQLDHHAYTADGIARKDDINIPFTDDPQILGKWKSVGFCQEKSSFDPETFRTEKLYFSEVEFLPDGEVISHYNYGKDIIRGREMQEWTQGYLLRKWNETACAYEIRSIKGIEYLIMEWKSGDYRWGGFDTDYYVFARA